MTLEFPLSDAEITEILITNLIDLVETVKTLESESVKTNEKFDEILELLKQGEVETDEVETDETVEVDLLSETLELEEESTDLEDEKTLNDVYDTLQELYSSSLIQESSNEEISANTVEIKEHLQTQEPHASQDIISLYGFIVVPIIIIIFVLWRGFIKPFTR